MFAIVLRVVILLITVKIVDYFANTPEVQIQRKLPEFEKVPLYDPRDNSFLIQIIL
ncbi:hypothetical protein HMPREF2097_00942 [Enterococcus faecalis 918]|nr:hypothetical protein EF10244_12960 [Enterococcus faecalis 10244]KDE17980.1 hypothetical protein HMPREF2097_00942 [Enterococcus faecalis 918]